MEIEEAIRNRRSIGAVKSDKVDPEQIICAESSWYKAVAFLCVER